MLTRDSLINKAIKDCLEEMYQKSQPSISFYKILEDAKNKKLSKNENFYEQHYLSAEEYKYILNKYIEAYAINPTWNDDVDFLKDCLKNGGLKSKYIKDYTDEFGIFHSGYRTSEEVGPLNKHLYEIIYDEYDGNGEIAERVANDVTNKVIEIIGDYQNFYKFGKSDLDKFSFNVMNYSPTSSKEIVKKYWTSRGVHFEIEDRPTDQNELWEIDNYGHVLEEDDE